MARFEELLKQFGIPDEKLTKSIKNKINVYRKSFDNAKTDDDKEEIQELDETISDDILLLNDDIQNEVKTLELEPEKTSEPIEKTLESEQVEPPKHVKKRKFIFFK